MSAVQAHQGQGVFPPNSRSRGDGCFRSASGASIEQRQTAGFAGEKPNRGAAGLRGRRTQAPSGGGPDPPIHDAVGTERLRRSFVAVPVNRLRGDVVCSEHRLRRLRELLARIEQLPASSERERMLGEVRARVVDVDIGVTLRAMLPVDLVPTLATDPGPPTVPAPNAVACTRADHDRGRPDNQPPQRSKAVPAAPADAGSASGPRTTAVGLSAAEDREWLALLVATNEVLSLDDSAQLASAGEARVEHDRRPWTRGLRG